MHICPGDALVIVGMQRDARPGDAVIARLNHHAALFARHELPVFAFDVRDPAGQRSLLARALRRVTIRAVTNTQSAFAGTDLAARLRALHCDRVFIGGLAAAGVRATALDALRAGFEVVFIEDAIQPAAPVPGDGARAQSQVQLVQRSVRTLRLRDLP